MIKNVDPKKYFQVETSMFKTERRTQVSLKTCERQIYCIQAEPMVDCWNKNKLVLEFSVFENHASSSECLG